MAVGLSTSTFIPTATGRGLFYPTQRVPGPYKKNDSCHVEQKSWTLVRRLVGHDRYTSRAAMERRNLVYGVLRHYAISSSPP